MMIRTEIEDKRLTFQDQPFTGAYQESP